MGRGPAGVRMGCETRRPSTNNPLGAWQQVKPVYAGGMRAKVRRLRWFLLFLLWSAVLQLPAQQSEADRKLLADIRAKAEKGEAQAQNELAGAFFFGTLGVT